MLHRELWLSAILASSLLLPLAGRSEEPAPPQIKGFTVSGGHQRIQFSPFPAVKEYQVLKSGQLGRAFTTDATGLFSGYDWTAPVAPGESTQFYVVKAVPMSPSELLVSTVLNRLAYGPTPDELERVRSIGPDAFIQEQLAPEKIAESLPEDGPRQTDSGWTYYSVTGSATSSKIYIYLQAAGDGYIDDIKLVKGTVAESGANLLKNGDFEFPLGSTNWVLNPNHTNSVLSTEVVHGGKSSLHVIASSPGATDGSAIVESFSPGVVASDLYTLSYWYHGGSNNLVTPHTVRLSGAGIQSPKALDRLSTVTGIIEDLRQWHVQHAIGSKKQLLEILLQFFENHFVTEYSKSADYLDGFYATDDPRVNNNAADLEFREIQRWREALLKPDCTFHDLLKISAESPAMIIYLDTVDSKGNAANIANENYARELLELFTFGVDNGYDQTDIVETSKTWTGWSIDFKEPAQVLNPLAPSLKDKNPGIVNTNLVELGGKWAFHYKSSRHGTTAKTIFEGKKVPDRFGPPYAGRDYQLSIPAGQSGTNGISEGYAVIAHLANQPFTQEFISVKLCRLFVHDGFEHGVYDYTAAELTPEAALVKKCMEAWESGSPKGQIRQVLATIFASELFRSHGSSLQKVKTPLEFVVSAQRALRARNADGTYTVQSDGKISDSLVKMGNMSLFNRAAPDGYPEAGDQWISASTLAERLRYIQSFLLPISGRRNAFDSQFAVADPMALMALKLPQNEWKNAAAVTDLFLDLLFPGEGKANLDLYRAKALQFLNTLNNGTSASGMETLSSTGSPSPLEVRIRGMVSMLMTLPRFQEQ